MLWVHLLESSGIGALAGTLVSLALIALLYWRGWSNLLIVVAGCVAFGVLGGFAWAWTRRPTLLRAALQIDQQLRLDDLVGTALSIRSASTDVWAQTIVAQAQARCAALTPGRLVLHRLSAAAWGAIGLVAMLSLTLAFLAASTRQMQARQTLRQLQALHDTADDAPARPLLTLSADASLRRPSAPAEGEDVPQPNALSVAPVPDAGHAPSAVASRGDAPAPAQHAAQPGDSTGSGSARTSSPQYHASVPAESARPPARAEPRDPSAVAGTGGGNESPSAVGGHDRATAAPAGRMPGSASSVAPWNASGWAHDITVAQHALQSDQIAPAYHDIVRDYFIIGP